MLFHDTQVFDRDFGVYKLWQELITQYQGFEFFHIQYFIQLFNLQEGLIIV